MSMSAISSTSPVNLAQSHQPSPVKRDHDNGAPAVKPAPAVAVATAGTALSINVIA